MTIRRARQLLADWLEPLTPEAAEVWNERDAMMDEVHSFLSAERAPSTPALVDVFSLGASSWDQTGPPELDDLRLVANRWAIDRSLV